jgi:FtsP/CotA-like multicopper oxidase with cupredoxin domain
VETTPAPQEQQDRRGPWVLAFLFGVIAIIVLPIIAIGIVAVATNDSDSGAGSGAAASTNASIALNEFSITGELAVPAGDVTLAVANEGAVAHNLVVEADDRTPDLNSGESYDLALGNLTPGTYELTCDIPGHADSGMVAQLTVSADGEVAQGEGGDHDAGSPEEWQALDDAMTQSMLAFPAETEGRGNIPLEPEIASDGAKVFNLTAEIVEWEVEPGKFVDAWTYNGMVPGPAIRVESGDLVRVVVDNQLPMGTDVHWHGIQTPNEMDGVAPITQPLIESGETFTYEFVAQRNAVGMYHAHHHGQMQVPNGMFGAFQIGAVTLPEGQTISGTTLPDTIEIAQEIPMVLNDAGVIGYSLNGKSFPATDPYVVDSGDWVLIHYYNEGLQIHPMHMHQFPQLIVAKDGIPLDHPYYADTINVSPGERYSVLVNPNDPGTWVWHCHILTHVERAEGMFGMVSAVIVQ